MEVLKILFVAWCCVMFTVWSIVMIAIAIDELKD